MTKKYYQDMQTVIDVSKSFIYADQYFKTESTRLRRIHKHYLAIRELSTVSIEPKTMVRLMLTSNQFLVSPKLQSHINKYCLFMGFQLCRDIPTVRSYKLRKICLGALLKISEFLWLHKIAQWNRLSA
jgi:hypothetical protein